MDLDEDAVGSGCGGGAGQRLDESAVARGMAGVDDHGQVRMKLQPRHRPEVERETQRGVERAYATLTQHDLVGALLEDVVRGHQQFVERARQSTLEHYGFAE